MCDKCKIADGECLNVLGETVLKLMSGDKESDSWWLDVYLMHDNKIEANFWAGHDEAIATVDLDIKYCPFCGREL